MKYYTVLKVFILSSKIKYKRMGKSAKNLNLGKNTFVKKKKRILLPLTVFLMADMDPPLMLSSCSTLCLMDDIPDVQLNSKII